MKNPSAALRGGLLGLSCALALLSDAGAIQPVVRVERGAERPAVEAAKALPSDQLIVRWRGASRPAPGRAGQARLPLALEPSVLAERLGIAESVARGSNLRLTLQRQTAQGAHVLRLDRKLAPEALQRLMAELRAADPSIEAVQVDRRMRAQATPNDPYFGLQWPLWDAVGGIRARSAWRDTQGANVTVAVIDTGVRPHNDVAESLVPGYDFVSDPDNSNDGDGRDADAIDPGDYSDDGDCGEGVPGSTSSWHGTHVAGTVAARSDNYLGIAGAASEAHIQPVRVLGKCGGYESDIADGMVWAAGGTVAGVPANATPSRVLNLSLGGYGECGTVFQGAIDAVRARGAVVVVAAGNGASEASDFALANCSGVIAVGATFRSGRASYYSNYGPELALSAPGGDMSYSDDDGVLSTVNTGLRGPVGDGYAYYQGTSMAAPHVSAVAALMLSVKPTLTPDQVADTLRLTARPFPRACYQCGRGLLDAQFALKAVQGSPVLQLDEVEGNDTLAQASRQRKPVEIRGALSSETDTDWYRVDLRPGRRLSAMLSAELAAADYDLYVFDAQGQIVTGSVRGVVWDDSLQYVNLGTRTARLYVQVLRYDGPTGNYRLKLFF